MKNNTRITAAVAGLLGIVIAVFCTPATVSAETLYTKEVTVTSVWLDEHIDEHIRDELATSKHSADDIVITGKVMKEISVNTRYMAQYEDESGSVGEIDDLFPLTLKGNYETVESLKKDITAGILNEYPYLQNVKLSDYIGCDKIVYEVQYKYGSELLFGEELKLPCTKADGEYELSSLNLYIARCRVSYVIEDGGEFFIPEDDYDFIMWENDEYPLEDSEFMNFEKSAFYNVDWKCLKKPGTVVGKLDKIEKNSREYTWGEATSYIIGHEAYFKLSEVLEKWNIKNRKLFQYDEKTNTLYYGTKPTEKDKLQKDEIYEFVKKATQGCKTDKEKLKAIHDAIVIKYDSYDSYDKLISSKSFSGYVMREDLYDAKKLMSDKVYTIDSFADLFKECCARLLIPCDTVDDTFLYWNRVYLGDKCYHIDTASDAKVTHRTKDMKIYRGFFLKSAYEFMGTHIWNGDDYTPEKFSKSWKNIDRNNIRTTDELRRAASYASYLSRDGKKHTYTFKIKGANVDTYCEGYAFHFGYVSNVKASYDKGKGILTIDFN